MCHIRLRQSERILSWRHFAEWGNGKSAMPEHLFKGMGSHSINRLHLLYFNSISESFLRPLVSQPLSLILHLGINIMHENSQSQAIIGTLLLLIMVTPDCSIFPCGLIQPFTLWLLKWGCFCWAKEGFRGSPSNITNSNDMLLRAMLGKIIALKPFMISLWGEVISLR